MNTTLLLSAFYPYLLVLTRVGTAFYFLPAFGESFVNPRIRLHMAAALALFLVIPLESSFPPLPQDGVELIPFFLVEICVGFFYGLTARLFLYVLEVAGSIIAFQSSLSMAQAFNPALSQPGTMVGSLLSILGLLLFFEADIHHLVLRSLFHSYTLFPVGQLLSIEDASHSLSRMVSLLFQKAVLWSGPFLILNTILFIALGLLNRLMPQLPVFFLATPVQLFIGMTLLMAVVNSIMGEFIETFRTLFLSP